MIDAQRKRVFAGLSLDWRTLKEICDTAKMTRHDAASALVNLAEKGQVEWKPMPKTMYRLKKPV